MLSKILSASIIGIDAYPVEVEVDISSRGLPHFSMVGLPDTAVKESRDRVRAALKNIGFSFPLKQITVNLAPADLKKEGSSYDLPIAIGIITSEGLIPAEAVQGYLVTGELSLDGRIKPVRGALSMAIRARDLGLKGLIVPNENAPEAAVVRGVQVIGMANLPDVISFLRKETEVEPFTLDIAKTLQDLSLSRKISPKSKARNTQNVRLRLQLPVDIICSLSVHRGRERPCSQSAFRPSSLR